MCILFCLQLRAAVGGGGPGTEPPSMFHMGGGNPTQCKQEQCVQECKQGHAARRSHCMPHAVAVRWQASGRRSRAPPQFAARLPVLSRQRTALGWEGGNTRLRARGRDDPETAQKGGHVPPPLCCACCAARRVNLRHICREPQSQQAVTYDSYSTCCTPAISPCQCIHAFRE